MSQRPAVTIGLGPKGKRYKIYDPGGGGRVAKILRTGTPYEVDVVLDMQALHPEGRAVDAGANIGNHSLWLAAVCGLQVEAFEPIRYEKLRANVELNGLEDRITIYRHALGATKGTARLVGKNRLETGGGKFAVVPLDDYGFADVSVLKVDVEGMDAEVIEGGLETIERNRPVVYAEAWDDDYRARIDSLLAPLGYSLTRRFRWNQNRWTPR